MPAAPDSDPLSRIFGAIADPTRRAILATLTQGPATVSEIAAPHDMSGPAISKHLRVLEGAGLITRGRDAQFRPATLAAEPLKEVVDYALDFRAFWDESFSRLDQYLAQLPANAASHANPDPSVALASPTSRQLPAPADAAAPPSTTTTPTPKDAP